MIKPINDAVLFQVQMLIPECFLFFFYFIYILFYFLFIIICLHRCYNAKLCLFHFPIYAQTL